MNYTLEQQKLRQAADESGGEINKHIHKLQQKCVWWEGGGALVVLGRQTEKQKTNEDGPNRNKNKNNNSPQFNLHNDSVKWRRL